MASRILQGLQQDQRTAVMRTAAQLLSNLAQPDQYVGELYSIGYEAAIVQIHDHHRMKVGGIPSLSFLIATRLKPGEPIDYTEEDSSLILLRVMDAAPLPNASEMDRIRAEAAQRASGADGHWDEQEFMDAHTANLLSYAGVKCRVIGTFFLEQRAGGNQDDLILKFGSDLSNYYPNKGLKVYKPNSDALGRIVNYREADRVLAHPLGDREVNVGRVRYASTNRAHQGIDDVRIHVAPADLIGQKTALFGMTRTGKSNTTKIIAKSVFDLRYESAEHGRIGQIIFDYNGEYANENVQDGTNTNPTALKNLWRARPEGREEDVITYGTASHPADPNRRLMRLNFYAEQNLQIGKEIINQVLFDYKDQKYIGNFIDVDMAPPEGNDPSETTRYRRAVLAYRTLLFKAGFPLPQGLTANTTNLFSQGLRTALSQSTDDPNGSHAMAAQVFSTAQPQWGRLVDALEGLRDFIKRGDDTGYRAFNNTYMQQSSTGSPWHDARLDKILGMFQYDNGARLIGRVLLQHSPSVNDDYAATIYQDLQQGRLVIVDQSAGEPEINRKVAERVMRRIFQENQRIFSGGAVPPQILLYIEEAHNLLPPAKAEDYQDIWVRTAKEGAKFRIGLVYATQEVSSIQKNILKNTANWFIGHLNNTDETRELCKYYDFEDFEPSIRRAQDRGFIRVKTLSNMFVVPAQINRFEV